MESLFTLGNTAGGTAFAGAMAVILLGSLLLFGLWIWSLIHCVTNKQLSDTTRIIGIILIVVLGLIGSLIYLFLPREQAEPRRRFDRRRTGTQRRLPSQPERADMRSRR